MRILVDAMGGDLAPDEIVKGAVHAQQELGAEIVLVGQRAAIEACLRNEQAKLEIIDASEVITMDDDPSTATRRKKDASMTVALNMLRDGKGDAVVSAGSTGALLTGATLIVKRIHGIRRAALAPVLPNGDAGVMLIDCGANADCTPEYLLQFAYMGSYYARTMLGIAAPRVGLLSNGTEDHKGDALHQAANELLKGMSCIDYAGNVEGRDIMAGDIDIAVADGFTGNIALKSIEGCGKAISAIMKREFKKNFFATMRAALVYDVIKNIKKSADYETMGGAMFLGLKKAVVKAHGNSKASGFAICIGQAVEAVRGDMVGKIEKMLAEVDLTEAAAKSAENSVETASAEA